MELVLHLVCFSDRVIPGPRGHPGGSGIQHICTFRVFEQFKLWILLWIWNSVKQKISNVCLALRMQSMSSGALLGAEKSWGQCRNMSARLWCRASSLRQSSKEISAESQRNLNIIKFFERVSYRFHKTWLVELVLHLVCCSDRVIPGPLGHPMGGQASNKFVPWTTLRSSNSKSYCES